MAAALATVLRVLLHGRSREARSWGPFPQADGWEPVPSPREAQRVFPAYWKALGLPGLEMSGADPRPDSQPNPTIAATVCCSPALPAWRTLITGTEL